MQRYRTMFDLCSFSGWQAEKKFDCIQNISTTNKSQMSWIYMYITLQVLGDSLSDSLDSRLFWRGT